MSTVSLPSYIAPSLNRTPSYSAEPHDYEQRIALGDRLRVRPSGNFVKQSKGGDAQLRLGAQEDNVDLPVYGLGGVVEGTVDLSKPEGVSTVEVKIEGQLRIKELGEGGTSTAKLCLDKSILWSKEAGTPCPSSLPFSLQLPSEFTYEDKTYPLPPSFYVKLSGLPGFVATIEYSVAAFVTKSTSLPKMRSKSLGIHIGEIFISTPFVYYPRSRPAKALPPPLTYNGAGFTNHGDWRAFESNMKSRLPNKQDISVKLYLPSACIFSMSQAIPFHLTLESSAVSLATYLPLSPTSNLASGKATRIQLMRQTTVDVRNTFLTGAKTDMWRVDCLGEGTFRHAGDAATSISFSGKITIDPSVKISGFKAAGLSVKDCILFIINPLEIEHLKAAFGDLRMVIPVRLATETWSPNGNGIAPAHEATWERNTPSPDTKYDTSRDDETINS